MSSDLTMPGGLASRYAAALYELADEAAALDTVAAELRDLRAAVDDNPALGRVLTTPLLDARKKASVLDAVLRQAGTSDLARRFVGVVAVNGRAGVLPAMITAFLAELRRRRGQVTAEVTAAQPLGPGRLAAVTEALNKRFGGQVTVDLRVDPGLIGGLVVKIGSRMIDFSLESKLRRLQLAMKGV